jgi:hypothetical protein
MGIRVARPQRLSAFFVSHLGGGVLNHGKTITYMVLKNGTPIPDAVVTLDAENAASGSPARAWSADFVLGDRVQIVAIPSSALGATVDIIEGTVA